MARTSFPRWGVVGGFVLLLFIGVILLSGQALAEVMYRLIVDGLLCLLWVGSAFGWGASLARFGDGAVFGRRPHPCPLPEGEGEKTGPLPEGEGEKRGPLAEGEGEKRDAGVAATEGEGESRDAGVAHTRVIASIALGVGILSLLVLGAGALHVLGPLACWIFILVGAGLAITWGLIHRGDFVGIIVGRSRSSIARYAVIALVPLASITLVSAIVPPGLLWGDEPNGYDVMEYHLELPREWYQTHSITPTENNVFSHFPLLVETQYLLAMEMTGGPWAGMYLAQLMHVALCGLAVLAVYGFAREENPPAAIPAALVMAAAPWLALVAPVAYNEGGLLLFGTLALGFALRALGKRTTKTPRHQGKRKEEFLDFGRGSLGGLVSWWLKDSAPIASLALAGVFAGFACSVKLTGVPMVLALVPAALWVSWVAGSICHSERSEESRRPRHEILRFAQDDNFGANLRQMVAGTLLFVVAALVIFSPWLIRDYLATHNPVFPELSKFFGAGYFSPQQVARWEIANHLPSVGHRSVAGRLWEFWNQIVADVRYAYVLIPLAVFAGVASLVSSSLRRSVASSLFLIFYLLGLAVFWTFFTHTQSRFFILAIPATALLVMQVRGHWALGIVWGLVAAELIISTIYMSGRFAQRVVPVRDAGAMGLENFRRLLPEDVDRALASDLPIALVGDAKAFFYPIDIRRLYYRTVFDVNVKPGESAIEAWTRGAPADAIEVVDPRELTRLARTYYGIPPLPADFSGPRDQVFVRGESGK